MQEALTKFTDKIDLCKDTINLLLAEAQLTKVLYKFAANCTKYKDFKRKHDAVDQANSFLNHGNYLAYGLAATTLWVKGNYLKLINLLQKSWSWSYSSLIFVK